jgi:hypothetical protein
VSGHKMLGKVKENGQKMGHDKLQYVRRDGTWLISSKDSNVADVSVIKTES